MVETFVFMFIPKIGEDEPNLTSFFFQRGGKNTNQFSMLFLFLGWLQTLLMIYCEQLKYIRFGEIILNHKVFISIWETIGMFEAWFV